VRTEILEAYRSARLRVYAIWTVKLTFDARDQWDGGGLSDPRVIHLWDPQDLLGDWFVAHEPGDQADDWDTYLLFGPQATWTSQPPPLISSGSSVIGTTDQLAQSISPLLKG
jgi:hypothetical protein